MLNKGKRRIASAVVVLMVVMVALAGCSSGASQSSSSTASSSQSTASAAADTLKSWTDDSATVKLVKEYVADVTNQSSANYIPPEDRIVTIDWDGTLYGELDPIYLDWAMYVHRVLWDSTYTPTAEQVQVARAIEQVEQTREFPDGLEAQHAKCLAEAFVPD